MKANEFTLIIAAIGIVVPQMCYAGYNIGKYELGMSHKQAATLGLKDCIDIPNKTIRCVPTGLPDVSATVNYVWFDAASKRLVTMRVESVRFHPFPSMSADQLWRVEAAKYEASFVNPLLLTSCGSVEPAVETSTTGMRSTCLHPKTDAYREVTVGYNREEKTGGGHGMHSTPGNTPHVGATAYMSHNPLIKHEFKKRHLRRQEEARRLLRPAELRDFERGL
jgi:hypothetical protein